MSLLALFVVVCTDGKHPSTLVGFASDVGNQQWLKCKRRDGVPFREASVYPYGGGGSGGGSRENGVGCTLYLVLRLFRVEGSVRELSALA